MEDHVVTCKTCKRAVYERDVDEYGNCSNCTSASIDPPSDEEQWRDLGRPDDGDAK